MPIGLKSVLGPSRADPQPNSESPVRSWISVSPTVSAAEDLAPQPGTQQRPRSEQFHILVEDGSQSLSITILSSYLEEKWSLPTLWK